MGGGANGTRLVCHLAHQTRHAGRATSSVRRERRTSKTSERANAKKYSTDMKSRHNQGFSDQVSRSTMAGTRTPDSEAGWQQKFFPGWNVNWHTASRR